MMVLLIFAGLFAGILTFADAEKVDEAVVLTSKPASFGPGIPAECVNAPNGPLPPVCQNLGKARGKGDAGVVNEWNHSAH